MLIQFQPSTFYFSSQCVCVHVCVCVRVLKDIECACLHAYAWLFICSMHGCMSGHGHSVISIYMQIVSPFE